MKRCEVCGGSMREGAIYRARDDYADTFCELPAEECVDCGNIQPDVEKLSELDPRKVPSSVRVRCAKIRVA